MTAETECMSTAIQLHHHVAIHTCQPLTLSYHAILTRNDEHIILPPWMSLIGSSNIAYTVLCATSCTHWLHAAGWSGNGAATHIFTACHAVLKRSYCCMQLPLLMQNVGRCG